MNVLGIETSCDETAAAVVRDARTVLSNVVHSQAALHAPYGGVVPEVAGRSHLDRVLPLVRRALAEASLTAADLDGIAVTYRPGLVGCLLVGVAVAKTLALVLDKPLVGVDHLQAHVDAAFLAAPDLELPLLCLVASGGHTNLYLVAERGKAERLGRTLDDAAGEALDKASAMLGLGYPGGPAIERAAAGGDRDAVAFKRSMLAKDSLDFSFSGLKTALLYELRGPGLTRAASPIEGKRRADYAASFQEAVMDTLVRKLMRAAEATQARTVAIGGGVARNGRLRALLAQDRVLRDRSLIFPPLDLCSDNAAMVAGLGGHLLGLGVRHDLDLEVEARSLAG
jgi:N6-L-threonylcarbamoyladenine synthase